jgi:hypothetical protein
MGDAARWRVCSDAAHATALDNTCEKAAERFEGALVRAIDRAGARPSAAS